MPNAPVVAELVRSGIVEGHHRGAVVALDATGGTGWSVGGVDGPILPPPPPELAEEAERGRGA